LASEEELQDLRIGRRPRIDLVKLSADLRDGARVLAHDGDRVPLRDRRLAYVDEVVGDVFACEILPHRATARSGASVERERVALFRLRHGRSFVTSTTRARQRSP